MTAGDDALDFQATCTGSEVARAAWKIPAQTLALLLGPDVAPTDQEEARSQFALWAVANAARRFDGGLWEAWDSFAAPKVGLDVPVVLLPGAACKSCASTRFVTGGTSARGYQSCAVCSGTGRTRPRALPAHTSQEVLTLVDAANHAAETA